jgi:hypothetical protein
VTRAADGKPHQHPSAAAVLGTPHRRAESRPGHGPGRRCTHLPEMRFPAPPTMGRGRSWFQPAASTTSENRSTCQLACVRPGPTTSETNQLNPQPTRCRLGSPSSKALTGAQRIRGADVPLSSEATMTIGRRRFLGSSLAVVSLAHPRSPHALPPPGRRQHDRRLASPSAASSRSGSSVCGTRISPPRSSIG